MLIIRATSSLAKKIKVSASTTIQGNAPFISEWYAKDFRFERANLVLYVNAKTFLPVVVKAAPYKESQSDSLKNLVEYSMRLVLTIL